MFVGCEIMQERYKNFTLLIAKINRCIRKIKTEEMSEFNLKSAHVSCLYYLYTIGSLTSKELCDICEEDKAAISRAVDHLENEGYLKSRTNVNKRYKCPIELTEKGHEVGRYLAERVSGIIAVSSAGISDEEREVLYRALSIISEKLQQVYEGYED